MNNNSLSSLIDNRISILNKYGLDDKSIKEFRSKIKSVSDSEKESLAFFMEIKNDMLCSKIYLALYLDLKTLKIKN